MSEFVMVRRDTLVDACHGLKITHERAMKELRAVLAQEAAEDEADGKLAFVRSNTKRGKTISMDDMLARYAPKPALALVPAQEAGKVEAVAWLNVATGNVTTSAVVVMDWDDEKEPVQSLYTSPPAPVSVVQHPFADKVISKLQRFVECADDGQGADIGRHWFDILTQLGLLNRVQRSPGLWEMTQQGEDCLDKVKELNQ